MDPDCPKSRKADAEGAELGGKTVLLHADITGVILGTFYAVHSELGSGFLEVVYENALTVLMRHAGFRVDHQVPFEIVFHGQCVRSHTVTEFKQDLYQSPVTLFYIYRS